MPQLSIDDLNRLYLEGKACDDDIFAEMRSNILLTSGDHFTKKHSKWLNRIRDAKELASDTKLRITQNHTYRIVKTYENNIFSQAPGVTPSPNNPKELQDQKAAELHKAVWEYAKSKHDLKSKIQGYNQSFNTIGEVAAIIYWDPFAGRFLGYEQAVDEMGQPQFDEMGQPVAGEKPRFSGDLVFREIYGFNLIRPSEAKSMRDAKWLCEHQMANVDDLKKLVGEDEDKLKLILPSKDDTFFVFDSSKGSAYGKSEKETMLKNFYFRPCAEYPNGYYYVCVEKGILFEGELPFGIFPIVHEGFDSIPTTPRYRSIIKQLRPFQAELNRACSQMATMQVTLGDDKIILQNGSKMVQGPHFPGVRSWSVTGQAPTILEGRTGAQYLEYYNSKLAEMYQAANLDLDSESDKGADPYAQLYKSIGQKKKFSIYASKFEGFLINLCKTYLELAKNYFDETHLIPAIGKSEYINISEFKNQEPLSYQIKLEPISDDLESMMGRHLVLNHVLQYNSQQLEKDDIGKILRQMPFVNNEEIFGDFTLNYDTATNIILALDRGEVPVPQSGDDGNYVIKRLSARQKQSDYQLLDAQIRANYDQMIQYYEQLEAEKAAKIQAAQADFVPASGAMIKVDYYIPDPNNKTRSIRATLPAESIDWLIKRLEEQGSAQAQLLRQDTKVQSEIAGMLNQLNGQAEPGPDLLAPQAQTELFQ